jgi:hypothetical protein
MVRIKNPDTGIEWEDERCACSACTRNVASKEGILSPGRHTPVMASVRTLGLSTAVAPSMKKGSSF